MGKHTGELLRKDIETKVSHYIEEKRSGDHLVCYFAHDSTLASFYQAFAAVADHEVMPQA